MNARPALLLTLLAFGLAGRATAQTPAGTRPLSLEEALGLAERESETVGLARAEVSRAEGERRRARSGYFPQLSGAASYTRTLRSQFSALQDDGTDAPAAPPPEDCPTFVPRPGLPVAERLDSLEAAVACASTADPFAAFSDLPFGQENAYRFGLSFSQTLFAGGRLRGQAQAGEAGSLRPAPSSSSTSRRPTTTRPSAIGWSRSRSRRSSSPTPRSARPSSRARSAISRSSISFGPASPATTSVRS
jgi:hypothetical protein